MTFLNKKGVTKPVLIMTIFGFYIAIVVLLGLMGTEFVPSDQIDTPPEDPSLLSPIDFIVFFFQGLSFTIMGLPIWFNILLFLPLGITIAYILLDTLIPG